MKRAGLLLGVFTLFVLAAAGISGAMQLAAAGEQRERQPRPQAHPLETGWIARGP